MDKLYSVIVNVGSPTRDDDNDVRWYQLYIGNLLFELHGKAMVSLSKYINIYDFDSIETIDLEKLFEILEETSKHENSCAENFIVFKGIILSEDYVMPNRTKKLSETISYCDVVDFLQRLYYDSVKNMKYKYKFNLYEKKIKYEEIDSRGKLIVGKDGDKETLFSGSVSSYMIDITEELLKIGVEFGEYLTIDRCESKIIQVDDLYKTNNGLEIRICEKTGIGYGEYVTNKKYTKKEISIIEHNLSRVGRFCVTEDLKCPRILTVYCGQLIYLNNLNSIIFDTDYSTVYERDIRAEESDVYPIKMLLYEAFKNKEHQFVRKESSTYNTYDLHHLTDDELLHIAINIKSYLKDFAIPAMELKFSEYLQEQLEKL